jgi:hypothetical protein
MREKTDLLCGHVTFIIRSSGSSAMNGKVGDRGLSLLINKFDRILVANSISSLHRHLGFNFATK